MTPDEFLDQVLFPAFNDNDLVTGVEHAFGQIDSDTQVLNLTMEDGSEWQVTFTEKP